jgi:anti-anti-sigma regulatory factor
MGQQDSEENESTMTLTNVTNEIMEVFEMTGFDDVLTIIK